jgi:hypothetical protein
MCYSGVHEKVYLDLHKGGHHSLTRGRLHAFFPVHANQLTERIPKGAEEVYKSYGSWWLLSES